MHARKCGYALLMAAACLVGCGPGYPETVGASGKVTLNGGAWPKGGLLIFSPTEELPDFPMRPATAQFAADGSFDSATTYEPGDGLLPGSYQVRVECWEQEPNMEGKPVKSYVPEKYHNGATSGLEVEVPAGGDPVVLNFDVLSDEK